MYARFVDLNSYEITTLAWLTDVAVNPDSFTVIASTEVRRPGISRAIATILG